MADETYGLCKDYIGLTDIALKKRYPLPLILVDSIPSISDRFVKSKGYWSSIVGRQRELIWASKVYSEPICPISLSR